MTTQLEKIRSYLDNVFLSENERALGLEERASIFSSDVNSDSQFYASTNMSLGYNRLSVQRVSDLKCNFVYNFYQKDEKTKDFNSNLRTGFIETVIPEDVEDQTFAILSEKKARYIEVKINLNGIADQNENIVHFDDIGVNPESQEMLSNASDSDLSFLDILRDHVIFEGNLSNNRTTGIEYFDTLADEKVYSYLSSSIFFSDTNSANDSLSSAARKFIDTLENNDNSFDLNQKVKLLETLSSLNSQGINNVNIQKPPDSISNLHFTTKFNNLFMGDLVKYATVTQNNIYIDEHLGIVDIAKQRQDLARSLAHDGDENAGELNVNVLPLPGTEEVFDLNDTEFTESEDEMNALLNDLKEIPKVKICGLLVSVYEINNNVPVFHENVILKDITAAANGFIYEHIKYGKTYLFKARTICLVKTIYDLEQEIGSSIMLGSFIVLSDPTSAYVVCEERVPPEAVTELSVQMNYEQQRPEIDWEFPLNMQRDIKKFQIFKRENFNQPFTLVQVNDFDNSELALPNFQNIPSEVVFDYKNSKLWPNKYVDYDFDIKNNDEAIYAIVTVDAHGMTSGYSKQIHVRHDKYRNKFISTVVSRAGAPQPYPNLYLRQDFFSDVIKQSNLTRCNIFFDPEYFRLFKKTDNNEEEINYITFTEDNNLNSEFPYQFHFINIDRQLDQVVEVNVANKSGIPEGIPAATINQNLTFDFNL